MGHELHKLAKGIDHDIHKVAHDIDKGVKTVAHQVKEIGGDVIHASEKAFDATGHLLHAVGDVATLNFKGAGHQFVDSGKDALGSIGDLVAGASKFVEAGVDDSPLGLFENHTALGRDIRDMQVAIGKGFLKVNDEIDKYTPLGLLNSAAKKGDFGGGIEKAAGFADKIFDGAIKDPEAAALTSHDVGKAAAGAAQLAAFAVPGFGEGAAVADGAAAAADAAKASGAFGVADGTTEGIAAGGARTEDAAAGGARTEDAAAGGARTEDAAAGGASTEDAAGAAAPETPEAEAAAEEEGAGEATAAAAAGTPQSVASSLTALKRSFDTEAGSGVEKSLATAKAEVEAGLANGIFSGAQKDLAENFLKAASDSSITNPRALFIAQTKLSASLRTTGGAAAAA